MLYKEMKMNTDQQKTSALLRNYRKILSILLIGLAFFHMLVSAFQYVIKLRVFIKAESIALLVIAGLSIIYFGILRFHESGWKAEIRPFLSRMITYEQIYLLFIAVWFVISCLVNQRTFGNNIFTKNRWGILDTFITAIAIFPTAAMLRDKAGKIIEWALLVLLFCYSSFTIYGLWHVFHLDFIKMPSDYKIMIRKSPMALQLCAHYNITAEIACSSRCAIANRPLFRPILRSVARLCLNLR